MSTPTWISNLSDPVLKGEFEHIALTGGISEAQMANAINAFAQEIGTTAATAAQIKDLHTIAVNLSSLRASPYLHFITDRFVQDVDANPEVCANAMRRWFQGAYLPGNSFTDYSGATPVVTTFSYQAVNAPLYSAGGPIMSDVSQGLAGDCYMMASLAEVAHQDPSAIQSMITDNQNGTYGVRFFFNGAARYVTVNNQLPNGGTLFASAGQNKWAALVEVAYAKVQAQGNITGCANNYGASYTTIGNTGIPGYALEEITNAPTITFFSPGANATTWTQSVDNQLLVQTSHMNGVTATSLLSTLAADLLVGDELVLTSKTDAHGGNGKLTLVHDHALSIYGYNDTSGLLEIRNPWGSNSYASGANELFEVAISTLRADADWITIANTGTATTVSGASAVAAAGLQSMSQITSFSVTDSAVNVQAGLSGLNLDTKLSSLDIQGTNGAETLILSGINAATAIKNAVTTIELYGNAGAAAVTGFASTGLGVGTATSVSLGAHYDYVALGGGSTTIDHTLGAVGGVEQIVGFNSAYDVLSLGLNGGSLEQTFANGGDWLSSSTDLTHGVFLNGVTQAQAFTVSNGVATVS